VAVLDPITLEVVGEGLISVVREMRATVFQTARSVAIYEARDFSCGLFDAEGRVVAQSEDIGSHVVPLPWSVEAALARFEERLRPGDVILMNDVYAGGTHLNDVTLVYPVFAEGELVFFPAVREHWADVGGSVPGSMSGTASEIYQEGMRIPPIRIVEGGEVNQAAMDLILSNMRVPDERLGDFRSGLAACRTAERRLEELMGRYGVETLLAAVAQNLDRSEAQMRQQIARLPDGDYYYEDYLESFGPEGFEPLLLPLDLKITGETLTADLSGASPQVPLPVNSTAAVTAASVYITLKSILDPDAALNHGAFRPVTVLAPEGTIVNVRHPAPAGSHGEIRKRVIATMLGALAQAMPERVSGDIHRTSFHNMIGGHDAASNRQWVHYEWAAGGNGALVDADGASAMAAIDWGDLSTVQPTEVLESRLPMTILFSRLGVDSGGGGRHRGGLGMRRAIRLDAAEATYSLLSDGAILPPFGVEGGAAAAPVDSFVRRDEAPLRFETPGKVGGFQMRQGDVVVLQSAGGGGYGDPLQRPAEAVAEDVAEGYVSSTVAADLYGVVLDADGAVDAAATAKQRNALEAARVRLASRPSETSLYATGRVSRRRICPLHPEDAGRIGVAEGDIVELRGTGGPPLRAWVRLDHQVVAGTVPADEVLARVLGLGSGDAVHVARLEPPAVG
jgi:N-methylhydantoinase B